MEQMRQITDKEVEEAKELLKDDSKLPAFKHESKTVWEGVGVTPVILSVWQNNLLKEIEEKKLNNTSSMVELIEKKISEGNVWDKRVFAILAERALADVMKKLQSKVAQIIMADMMDKDIPEEIRRMLIKK